VEHPVYLTGLFLSRVIRIQSPPNLIRRVPGQPLRCLDGVKVLNDPDLRAETFELRAEPVGDQLVSWPWAAEWFLVSPPSHPASIA